MRRRSIGIVAAAAAGLMAFGVGPASAWDCIRYSNTEQGLAQSTRSGNWEAFTIESFAQGAVDGGAISRQQADCAVSAWHDAGMPDYFALGTGVAGARGAQTSGHLTEDDFFVLAKNAPERVTGDGQGIDHFETVLVQTLGQCFAGPVDGD